MCFVEKKSIYASHIDQRHKLLHLKVVLMTCVLVSLVTNNSSTLSPLVLPLPLCESTLNQQVDLSMNVLCFLPKFFILLHVTLALYTPSEARRCSISFECYAGETCVKSRCVGRQCSRNVHCSFGQVCINGHCSEDREGVKCSLSSDCGMGMTCYEFRCKPTDPIIGGSAPVVIIAILIVIAVAVLTTCVCVFGVSNAGKKLFNSSTDSSRSTNSSPVPSAPPPPGSYPVQIISPSASPSPPGWIASQIPPSPSPSSPSPSSPSQAAWYPVQPVQGPQQVPSLVFSPPEGTYVSSIQVQYPPTSQPSGFTYSQNAPSPWSHQ